MKWPRNLVRKACFRVGEYIPGKPIEQVQREYGLTDVIKLASNENPLGPSPKAVAAIRRALCDIHYYPETDAPELREKLAAHLCIAPEMIVVSNGGDNVLSLIAHAFLDDGDEVIVTDPAFGTYENVSAIMGAEIVRVPLKRYRTDLDSILERVTDRTKLVFICNPNNPTGTAVTDEELSSFLRTLPSRTIAVLDEAYADFADDPSFPKSIQYCLDGLPVIIVRTFSKLYGLAGLRIGYGISQKTVIEQLNRVKEPFSTNRLAVVAAVAALDDEDHVSRTIDTNKRGKRYLYRELERLGLSYVPTQANFILIDLGRDGLSVFEDLLRRGVIVRQGIIWGYPTCIRVSVGRQEDNERFINALEGII